MLSENENQIMMFTIENVKYNLKTCVGVLEFTAKEGTVIVPTWVFRNNGKYLKKQLYRQLEIVPGTIVKIEMTELKLGEYARFQPLKYDFLDIDNPKIV